MMLNESEKLAVDVVCNMTSALAEARVAELRAKLQADNALLSSERQELTQLRLGLALSEKEESVSFNARFNSRLAWMTQRSFS